MGLSTALAVGASSGLEKGAILLEETALHVMVSRSLAPSVSTQIAALRKLLPRDRHSLAAAARHNAFARVSEVGLPAFIALLKMQF